MRSSGRGRDVPCQVGGPPPQVIRAIENLKLAIRLRISGGTASKEQLHKIAEAIDAATIAIKRG